MNVNEIDEDEAASMLSEECGISKGALLEAAQEKLNEYNGLLNQVVSGLYLVAYDLDEDMNKILGNNPDHHDIEKLQRIDELYKIRSTYRVAEGNEWDLVPGDDWTLLNLKIADDTGRITLNLWNDMAEIAYDELSDGDEITVKGAYLDEYKGQKQLKISKKGYIELPDGTKITGPDYEGD